MPHCREAQLLAEIGQLKEGQRKKADGAPQDSTAVAPGQPTNSQNQKLDNLHRDLFLAAAQHMLKDFSGKVVQVRGEALQARLADFETACAQQCEMPWKSAQLWQGGRRVNRRLLAP